MEDVKFLDFLETIDNNNKEFVYDINHFLLEHGCHQEIKSAKSGFTVSYILKQTKKTISTFVCRKTGVKLRIYPSNLNHYEQFLGTLPDKMKKEIIKSSVCKRLINPNECNSKCTMGYDFYMDKEHYQKCRYMAFMPTINQENIVYIMSFLENEFSYLEKIITAI